MNKEIILQSMVVEKNRVDFNYFVPEELKPFFNLTLPFFYEYPENINLDEVPLSVLCIPFVMNFMPLVWISGAVIKVDELDLAFFNSLSDILKGINEIYEDIDFRGNVIIGKLVENQYHRSIKKTALFSGGVDAVSTLISHIEENPLLVNIWGADLKLDDCTNHNSILRSLNEFAYDMGLSYMVIKTSLRYCFIESQIEKVYGTLLKDTWWHGMQHSIGMLSLLAPYNFLYKTETNYIASSYTIHEYKKVRCISYPIVDNALKMMSVNNCHDGFELRRIDKIHNIVAYAAKNHKRVLLKVCWYPIAGENCCNCEKCLRTIAAILSVGGNPNDFGFDVKKKKIRQIKRFLDFTILNDASLPFWEECKEYALSTENRYFEIKWLAHYKFNNGNKLMRKIRSIMSCLWHLFRKITTMAL